MWHPLRIELTTHVFSNATNLLTVTSRRDAQTEFTYSIHAGKVSGKMVPWYS